MRKAFGLSSIRMETWQQSCCKPFKKLTDIYSLNTITDDKSFKNTGSDICKAGRYGQVIKMDFIWSSLSESIW